MSMAGKIDRVEMITSVQWRRRWSAQEKTQIVQETYAPGTSVSPLARQQGDRAEPAVHLALYAEGAGRCVLNSALPELKLGQAGTRLAN